MFSLWLVCLCAFSSAAIINATEPDNITATVANPAVAPAKAATAISAESILALSPEQNSDIYGCRWPDDFVSRLQFCLDKSGIPVPQEDRRDAFKLVTHGVLDGQIIDSLMGKCGEKQLTQCVREVDDKRLSLFVDEWQSRVDNYTTLQACLQKNTEAMNKLCGSQNIVSKVSSGAAGLHLNLLNVLVHVERELHQPGANISTQCLHKVAAAVHVTAVLYLKSKHYRENSVLCWSAARKGCDKTCAAFAAELNCLHAACPGLPAATLQQLGIWQWYYLDPASTRATCAIHDDECTVTDAGIVPVDTAHGMSSLFDVERLKEKFNEVKHDLEERFHMPFTTIALIFLASLAVILVLFTIFCCWAYGLLIRRRRTTRYSRLLDSKLAAAESRVLSSVDDHDDDDIE